MSGGFVWKVQFLRFVWRENRKNLIMSHSILHYSLHMLLGSKLPYWIPKRQNDHHNLFYVRAPHPPPHPERMLLSSTFTMLMDFMDHCFLRLLKLYKVVWTQHRIPLLNSYVLVWTSLMFMTSILWLVGRLAWLGCVWPWFKNWKTVSQTCFHLW